MKISEIYTQYKIMPSLQLHMYRVTGVAKMICENLTVKMDKENIIAACLLHDMGNILKFNLPLFPEFLQPEGLKYWQDVKDSYRQKYGDNEHEATLKIAKEIGISDRVVELIDSFSFSKAEQNLQQEDLAKKICTYSDMRVKPYGVASLEERLADGRKRFKLNKGAEDDEVFFNKMASALVKIEEEVFSTCSIKPEDIIDEKVNEYIEELKDFEVC